MNNFSIIDSESQKWLRNLLGDRVRFDEPMAYHTSFKIGGPVDAFISPATIEEINLIFKWCHDTKTPYFIIGNGTNLLVKDRGFRGVGISILHGFKTITLDMEYQNGIKIYSMSGVRLGKLCAVALKNGWRGLNFALGIPGTVGGAIRMNAGTKYGTVENSLESIDILSPERGYLTLNSNQIQFDHRKISVHDSVNMNIDKAIIIGGGFVLKPSDPNQLRKEAKEIIKERKSTQPIGIPSAGCFFKNPLGQHAGKLIDQAGLKGKQIGGAMVSAKHANFIVNYNHASAQDVIDLAELVRETVYCRFGVHLETEVTIIGE